MGEEREIDPFITKLAGRVRYCATVLLLSGQDKTGPESNERIYPEKHQSAGCVDTFQTTQKGNDCDILWCHAHHHPVDLPAVPHL